METSMNEQLNMRKKAQPPPSGRRRKVLLIFPYDYQKSPRSVREIKLLKENNYDPVVISTELRYVVYNRYASLPSSPNVELSHDFPVYRLPFFLSPLVLPKSTIFSKIFLAIFYLMSTIFYSFWLFILTLTLCAANKICVMHVHNAPDLPGLVACLVSKLTGISYIYEVHDLAPSLYAEDLNLQSDSIILRLLESIEYIAVSNSGGDIFVSETMKKLFISSYDLPPSRCVVVYSAWNKDFPPKYSDEQLHALIKENSLDNKFKILYLGSMEEWFKRGLDILIESLNDIVHESEMREVVLILVGNGDGMEKLMQLTQKYQIGRNVLFTGMLQRRDAYKWLNVADIAVVPTRRAASTEIAVGNKTLEYMAAGKAIVASNLVGNREVIEDGRNGMLFRAGDHKDLAEKIKLLTRTKERDFARKLGANARRDFRENFCWEKQQTKILGIYSDLLQNQRARAL